MSKFESFDVWSHCIIHKIPLPTQKNEAVINRFQKDPVRTGSEKNQNKNIGGTCALSFTIVRGRSHKIVKGNEGNSVLGKYCTY